MSKAQAAEIRAIEEKVEKQKESRDLAAEEQKQTLKTIKEWQDALDEYHRREEKSRKAKGAIGDQKEPGTPVANKKDVENEQKVVDEFKKQLDALTRIREQDRLSKAAAKEQET